MVDTSKTPAIRRRVPYNTNTFKNKINVDTLLIHSNATLIRVKNARGYSCMFCREQFIEPSDLKKHAVEEHSRKSLVRKKTARFLDFAMKMDITGLCCKICDRSIPKLTDLMAHLQVEHKKELFSDLKSQIVPFKFETKEMICVVCSNKFSTFKQLQEHMNCHFPNYVCEICGAGFVTKPLLIGHKKNHESSGEFKCNECDKTFPTIKKRKMHVRRVHFWRGKVIKCNYCEDRFVDYWKKMEHLTKAHGVPPLELKCQACDQTFNNRRTLARHTKRDHLLERKHECQECDKKFFERKSLQEHMTKHTGVTEIFQCDICSKTYTRRKTLREHIKIHNDVKQFNCKHCGLGFTQKHSWKTHMRTKHVEIV